MNELYLSVYKLIDLRDRLIEKFLDFKIEGKKIADKKSILKDKTNIEFCISNSSCG